MNTVAPAKIDAFASPFRHPRFVIGGSGLGAFLLVELVASLLMGQLI